MKPRDSLAIQIETYLAHEGLVKAPHPARLHVEKIISLIESKLPMVEDECKACEGKGWYYFLIEHDGMGHPTQTPCICKHGKTTRRMTMDEGIEKLNEPEKDACLDEVYPTRIDAQTKQE